MSLPHPSPLLDLLVLAEGRDEARAIIRMGTEHIHFEEEANVRL